jgi:hypothetical protein
VPPWWVQKKEPENGFSDSNDFRGVTGPALSAFAEVDGQAFVDVAAVGAHAMGLFALAALGAACDFHGGDGVVCAAHAFAAFAGSGDWEHGVLFSV